MITADDIDVAKALWKEARIAHALSISGLGLLKQNASAIINSIIALDLTQAIAVNEYEKYIAAHQETVRSTLEAMSLRENEYAKLQAAYKVQNQQSTPI
ncbi:hypothetical protein [Pseudomonas savastanoi]|uniref:Uncharacterized protein n=1 Tax=Pseudomonas savastanoi TaxID=29438 RepID=A0AAW3LSR3_PSESS|nr:hypothetical protein [Pseudomonas savastanoi]KTC57310.1 hypothetical protein AO287_21270 [Pseudomonas savastanoi]